MPGKKQLDSDSSALCGGAALAGTTPKGVGPHNGGQTLVRVVASQTFAYETKKKKERKIENLPRFVSVLAD